MCFVFVKFYSVHVFKVGTDLLMQKILPKRIHGNICYFFSLFLRDILLQSW